MPHLIIFANYPIWPAQLFECHTHYSTRLAQFIIECRAAANDPIWLAQFIECHTPIIPFGWCIHECRINKTLSFL
jgi:hypothetical protein